MCARLFAICLLINSFVSVAQSPSTGPTLRREGYTANLLIGAATGSNETYGFDPFTSDPSYTSLLETQFSLIEPMNAMKAYIIAYSGVDSSQYYFTPADEQVMWARAHNMAVDCHNLVWGSNQPYTQPATFINFASSATPAQMLTLMDSYIAAVAGHFQGKCRVWDVVNEPFDQAGNIADSIWYNQPGVGLPGAGFIERAFADAKLADPNAKLFINLQGAEMPRAFLEALKALLTQMIHDGTPIDGVGFESHIDDGGAGTQITQAGMVQAMQEVVNLGVSLNHPLLVRVSELDDRVSNNGEDPTEARLLAASTEMQAVVNACRQVPQCISINFWGVDGNYVDPGKGVLFDKAGAPTPAFSTVLGAVAGRTPQPVVLGLQVPIIKVLQPDSNVYTTPAGTNYLVVEMVGGGGGGAGSGQDVAVGSNGSASTFGDFFAGGGWAENSDYSLGLGGTAANGDINMSGQPGQMSGPQGSYTPGAMGGNSVFGGGGGALIASSGTAGSTSSGSGGAGGGLGAMPGRIGGGGGAGAYMRKLIQHPATSYQYAIGVGGMGGVAASGFYNGGNGADGIIIVTAY